MIDPSGGTLITNIPLGGKPEYGASAGDGKVYTNLTDTNDAASGNAFASNATNHRVFIVSAKFGPPPAGATGGRGRGAVLPGSFTLMVIEPEPVPR